VTAAEAGVFTFDARGLSPGLFTFSVSASSPDGDVVHGELAVRVAAWLGVRLPAAPAPLERDGDAFTGALAFTADGNVPVTRLIAVVGPFPDGRAVTGSVRVVDAGGSERASAGIVDGRGVLEGMLLDAFEEDARLEVSVDALPGLAAGRHELPVRVLLVPNGGGDA
jgi:hypothetical protein